MAKKRITKPMLVAENRELRRKLAESYRTMDEELAHKMVEIQVLCETLEAQDKELFVSRQVIDRHEELVNALRTVARIVTGTGGEHVGGTGD